MASYDTFHRPKGVQYDLIASEVNSGSVAVQFMDNPQNTDDLIFVVKVENSGVVRSDFKSNYNVVSGTVVIENGSDSFRLNDVVTIIGMKYV